MKRSPVAERFLQKDIEDFCSLINRLDDPRSPIKPADVEYRGIKIKDGKLQTCFHIITKDKP